MIPIFRSDNGVALIGPRGARRHSGGPSASLVLLWVAIVAIIASDGNGSRAGARPG